MWSCYWPQGDCRERLLASLESDRSDAPVSRETLGDALCLLPALRPHL